jgi:hypothetical protein
MVVRKPRRAKMIALEFSVCRAGFEPPAGIGLRWEKKRVNTGTEKRLKRIRASANER